MPLVAICCRGCCCKHCEPPMYDTAHVRFNPCHLSLDGSYNLSGNQPIQTLLFVTQCSSTCREGNCRALLCAHDLEEEVVVTVKVQLYRTSEIVVSRWLGAWSMAMAALFCY